MQRIKLTYPDNTTQEVLATISPMGFTLDNGTEISWGQIKDFEILP